MTREMILRNRLEMASHNLFCLSDNYLCTTPKAGKEEEHRETAAEVEMLKAWIKEFNPNHNPEKCTARRVIAFLKVTKESILKMAGGGIADEDQGMYLRAYSNDIQGIIDQLKTIAE